MRVVFRIALGIIAAIGGFLDIGDLVFNTQAGANFGYDLLWAVAVGTIGIGVYAEMCGRVAAVFAGQPAVRQWEIRQQPNPETLAGGDTFGFRLSGKQTVMILCRHKTRLPGAARDPVGVGNLPRREMGMAKVADLALAHEFVERGDRFLDRCARVGPVHLIEVDVIGIEPPQARLARLPDIGARPPFDRTLRIQSRAPFGGDHDPVATIL